MLVKLIQKKNLDSNNTHNTCRSALSNNKEILVTIPSTPVDIQVMTDPLNNIGIPVNYDFSNCTEFKEKLK